MKLIFKQLVALVLSLALVHTESVLLPVWAEDAGSEKSLEGVEVGENQVTLQASEPLQYRAFVTANPPRLIVELSDTAIHMASKSKAGKGDLLKGVRIGQFKGGDHPVARVVLDLNKASEYQVQPNGGNLLVQLKSSSAEAKKPAAASRGAAMVDAPGPADPGAAPIQAAKKPRKLKRRKSDEADFDEATMTTTADRELNTVAKQESAEEKPIDMADAPAPAPPAPAAFHASKRARRDIMSTLPRDLISLDFDNTDIHDILRLVANKTKLNVVAGQDVSGTLTLHLAEVPFDEAFGMILSIKGLVVTQVGDNILRVMSPATLEKERAATVGTTRIYQLNYSNALETKTAIDAVRTAEKRLGSTTVDTKNNALIITDTPEGHSAIEHLLSQIDVKPQQVLIESKLVEVKLSKELDLGIQWDYFSIERGQFLGKKGVTTNGATMNLPSPYSMNLDQNFTGAAGITTPFGTSGGPAGATGRGTGVDLTASNIAGALTIGRITNNYLLSATLSAAASQGKVKVLSDPKIATLNGKQASINITTQIPYVTSSVASTGVATQSVSYTTTGIQLAVTPTINADRRITLKVQPNVSQPSTIAAAAGGTGAVSVDSRQADTTVLVRDGETIVIGGLITDSLSDVTASVPLLGDIPFLGWLFKKKTKIRSRVELLIFVTTKILDD